MRLISTVAPPSDDQVGTDLIEVLNMKFAEAQQVKESDSEWRTDYEASKELVSQNSKQAGGFEEIMTAKDAIAAHIRKLKAPVDQEKGGEKDDSSDKENQTESIELQDDLQYDKYFDMVKLGKSLGAIRNALYRDGLDAGIMALESEIASSPPEHGLTRTQERNSEPARNNEEQEDKQHKVSLNDDPNPGIMGTDPQKSISVQDDTSTGAQIETESEHAGQDNGKQEDTQNTMPLKDDKKFSKYYNMLRLGIPEGAVRNALQRDGLDPDVLDMDPEKAISEQGVQSAETGRDNGKQAGKQSALSLKDDPKLSKYWNMLRLGVPAGAVKNALQRDGLDPCILDLEEPMEKADSSAACPQPTKTEKKRVRRKQFYWTAIEHEKIKKRSIWFKCRDKYEMQSLKYDVQEFDRLFIESPKKEMELRASKGGNTPTIKKTKGVKFVDNKRGINAGILLSHLKMKYGALAGMIDSLDSGNLSTQQLRSLREILPSYNERKALTEYVRASKNSSALDDLSECEKFMIAVLEVPQPGLKLDYMLFRDSVYQRLDDLIVSMETVRTACTEVSKSRKLRKVMGMILTVVNHINSGENGKGVAGFNLDSLLKLSQSKAFDKKTSLLEYLVVNIMRENDENLLSFSGEIESAFHARNIVLDVLASDLRVLREELYVVQKFAKEEADRLEEEDEETKPLFIMKKDSTDILFNVGLGSLANKAAEEGRTTVEKFSIRAAAAIQGADDTFHELKRAYGKVLAYFAEDETMPSNEFFGTLCKFAEEFNSLS